MTPHPTDERLAGRAVAFALLLAFAAIAWSQYEPYTFLHGDGAFYANINKSLWHDGTIEQSDYHPRSWLEQDLGWNRNLDQGWSNVSLGRGGRWMPKHSFVLPLFATPLYGLFGLDGLLVFQVLMMTLLLVSAYHVAARLLPPWAAAIAAVAMSAQPVISGDIYSYNNDAFYSALLLSGTWAFLERRLVISGLLLGVAVWAKATNVLFVAPLGLWLLLQRDWRGIGRALAAFAVPVALFLASNWVFYGGPLTTSYSNILVREDGRLTTEGIGDRFTEPAREGLERVLVNEREGLLPRAPLMLVAAVGALLMLIRRRQRALGAVYLAVLVAFLALHAKYHYIYARFFLPVAGLAVAPLGALLHEAARLLDPVGRFLRPRAGGRLNPAFVGAAALGAALLVGIATAVNPPPGPGWRLYDHVERAVVHQGDRVCDYFNNQRQKFECHGDRGHQFFWGRATGEDQCTFDGEPQPMLWLHPPRRRGTRTMAFEDLPAGRLRLLYGLAETSRQDDVRFSVTLAGRRLDLPPIERIGALRSVEVPVSESGARLVLEVRGPPADWRHLCVDGFVTPAP